MRLLGDRGNAVTQVAEEGVERAALVCLSILRDLPWWVTKYFIATPLVAPYFLYAKALAWLTRGGTGNLARVLRGLPLFDYSMWIAQRGFAFFRHVAFDQLVTPQTRYISRSEVDAWLRANPAVAEGSTYVIMRNGNSWKFGGQVAAG